MTSFLESLQPLQPLPTPRRDPEPQTAAILLSCAEEVAAAKGRVAGILDSARREAEEILEDARIQAEAFREAAWAEGFHGGQTAGRAAMEMTLRDEWDAEKQALRTEIRELVENIGAARQALWERQESEMVAFVLAIARQVIKTEVSQNPEIVRNIIQNALRRVTDKEQVRLRVSVGDAGRVRGMRDEFLAITDGLRQMEIVDDRRVGDGGCVIETGAGTIDAKIETQLAEVERAVMALTPSVPPVPVPDEADDEETMEHEEASQEAADAS